MDVIRQIMDSHGYNVSDWSFQLSGLGKVFSYELVLHAAGPLDPSVLVGTLSGIENLQEYRLSPSRG